MLQKSTKRGRELYNGNIWLCVLLETTEPDAKSFGEDVIANAGNISGNW